MRTVIGLLFVAALEAHAGDAVIPRKIFKESSHSPPVFRADGYLVSAGPPPLRFSAEKPPCGDRSAPPLTDAAKGSAKKEPAAVEEKIVDPPAPAFPPPADAQLPKRDGHDFSRVPDEVLDFFKNTEGRPMRRAYLFDPIFEPAQPHELPKSKATIQQK